MVSVVWGPELRLRRDLSLSYLCPLKLVTWTEGSCNTAGKNIYTKKVVRPLSPEGQ